MKIVYIDNNETIATMFRQIVAQYPNVECTTISDSKKAVINLIETPEPPNVIVLSCGLKDIACKTLVGFIRKRTQLDKAAIVIIGDYFSAKEDRQYTSIGVNECVQVKFDVDTMKAFIERLLRF